MPPRNTDNRFLHIYRHTAGSGLTLVDSIEPGSTCIAWSDRDRANEYITLNYLNDSGEGESYVAINGLTGKVVGRWTVERRARLVSS